MNLLDRLDAIARDSDDFHIGLRGQKLQEALAPELFVVGDDHPDFRHESYTAAAAGAENCRNGIRIWIRVPGRAARNAQALFRFAVEMAEPLACVGKSYPEALRTLRFRRHPRAVIPHAQNDVPVISHGSDVDHPPSRPFLDAVTDRVFHQGLQNKSGHAGFQRIRIDLFVHLQPVFKTHLLYADIAFQKCEFLIERDLLRIGMLQGEPQQIAELADHAPCAGGPPRPAPKPRSER